ncbi:hypothetical protein AGMMS49983_13880 [Clostridia bacterium]|nr:hypothetical protein AGMMS49983_13880 [Clostridia bacterium]
MYNFKQCELSVIAPLRKAYLDSLPEAQELFLEWIVTKGTCYLVRSKYNDEGYFIISADAILVEFYLNPEVLPNVHEVFAGFINEKKITQVLCKSFDGVLLGCCLHENLHYKLFGKLFRGYSNVDLRDPSAFTYIVFGTEDDYDMLIKYDSGLYDTQEDLYYLLKNRQLLKYYVGKNLIGCGFLISLHEFGNHTDIGMWVDTPFRQKGYATRIIADLKWRCLTGGLIPTCGCAAENTASKHTLEKNGFYSRYDLIFFSSCQPTF